MADNEKQRPKFPRPSTRDFFREARQTPGYSLFDFLHGYVYLRWVYLYISIGVGAHPLARIFRPLGEGLLWLLSLRSPDELAKKYSRSLADSYHGKVLPLESAKRLITVGQDITMPNLEKIIPYAQARDIILRNPDHVVALECPCRSARPNPCLPLDVCLIVGEPFASLCLEHHPRRTRRISSEEAVAILQAEHERGHVHHAFFKDAMLGRFYAICNCCSCCCGAIRAWQSGVPMLASSGYVVRVDEEQCVGCGLCARSCPFQALAVEDRRVVADTARCMGCGVCTSVCKREALSLERDPSKGEPLEIRELLGTLALKADVR